jgi:hypothetical protein
MVAQATMMAVVVQEAESPFIMSTAQATAGRTVVRQMEAQKVAEWTILTARVLVALVSSWIQKAPRRLPMTIFTYIQTAA